MKFAAGWGASLSLRAVSGARLSPHPVEHLTMLADPPPPGEGKATILLTERTARCIPLMIGSDSATVMDLRLT
jgi:hypothetical protein